MLEHVLIKHVEGAKELNIKISNAQYSPNCTADFAIMLEIMLNRKVLTGLKRTVSNDFSLPGLQGQEMKKYITYVDIDYLFENSDIISLHTPLFDSNYHINIKDSIEKMKKGVKIINTARGELIDTQALIKLLSQNNLVV